MVLIKLSIVFILAAVAAITPVQVVALPHGDRMGLTRRSAPNESHQNTGTSKPE